jgi:phenylacetate-CoA ligase
MARMHSLVLQLQQSQWWSEERLLAYQLEQIRILAEHAAATAPFFADRLEAITGLETGKLTMQAFRQVPILTRQDIQAAKGRLFSSNPPPGHGKLLDFRTSGSTGQPVHIKSTSLTSLVNDAIALRYHLWHRRDFTGKNISIKAIRLDINFRKVKSWVTGYPSGPGIVCNLSVPLDELFELIIKEDPDYLQCRPHTLRALIGRSLELGVNPQRLREVRTMSETLSDELRGLCREQWKVPVSDNYSCEELAIMSVQCPDHPWGHVQSEKVLIEVLDEEDQPCPIGKPGRVVVTALHNFATPLIRYDLGDYVELGPACPCGRGLPVLKRIAGRKRNMVVLPSGEKLFPVLDVDSVIYSMPIRRYQLVQKTLEMIEVRLVADRSLTADEEHQLSQFYRRCFRHPFSFQFVYMDEITPSAGGKYEAFRSEVGG